MRKLSYLFGLLLIGILINAGSSSDIIATTYMCEEGGCTTTINEYDGGYNWSILCDDGSNSSGNMPGAEYSGNCPEQLPEQN